VLTADDCDDALSELGSVWDDGDCDGVLTTDDCDDALFELGSVWDDGDCDGVLTADDCNDTDAESTVVATDGDCDMVLTADDCDDADGTIGAIAMDADCDGRGDYVLDHGAVMVEIEAQTFGMGASGYVPLGGDPDPPWPIEYVRGYTPHTTAHYVTLTNDFFIGETEVTQDEYEALMGTNPSLFIDCGSDCPVENVTWNMAAAYTNAVSDSEGLEHCYTCTGSGTATSCVIAVDPTYSCDGYRLPTEAEWEAAARCGEDTYYAGSSVIDEVAWYADNSGGTTHPVTIKAPNACGLFDMNGNVLEWVVDNYATFLSGPVTDPVGYHTFDWRVLRGGAWDDLASEGIFSRMGIMPIYANSTSGFRLARTSP
jgi:formylglycine-generating enzyme required for sulfatase activity